MIVVTALVQQRAEGAGAGKIREMFGVSRLTLERWLSYFREFFPHSSVWQVLRSRFMPPVATDSIPLAVLERLGLCRGDPLGIVIRCVRLLSAGAGT